MGHRLVCGSCRSSSWKRDKTVFLGAIGQWITTPGERGGRPEPQSPLWGVLLGQGWKLSEQGEHGKGAGGTSCVTTQLRDVGQGEGLWQL